MSETKNDIAWEKLFQKHEILKAISNDGHFYISSTQINEFREARLMTKFDHKSQLPKLFANNKLSILPTARGSYVIGTFETFSKFTESSETEIISVEFPSFLESIDYQEITSESIAINCAFVSDILKDFVNEEELYPTVSGRMGSSSFNFEINSLHGRFNAEIVNAQIEIDGGYEGANSLTLIEAKNHISSDFLIRQLFYPLKLWTEKVNKKVRPVFLTYSNGIFHLREYEFEDLSYYNSLKLINQRKYILKDGDFNLEVLDEILNKTETITEPRIPFPQADNFDRIVNLCELLDQTNFLSKEEITENYDFDPRQTDYYSNACRYLGLLDIGRDPNTNEIGCYLTKKGKEVFSLNLFERQKEFVKAIIEHEPFKKTLEVYLRDAESPSKEQIVEIMKESSLHNITADTTYERRASTISGWINWIIDQLDD